MSMRDSSNGKSTVWTQKILLIGLVSNTGFYKRLFRYDAGYLKLIFGEVTWKLTCG
jgi:hypothetical protein